MRTIQSFILLLLLSAAPFSPAIANLDKHSLLESLLKDGKYEEAETEAKRLLQQSPDSQNYQFALAQIYLNTQQYDEAEEFIEKVLEHEQLEEKHWLMASGIYGMQAQESSIFSKLGYAKKAKSSLKSLLTLNPRNEEGLIGMIQFHMAAPGIAGGDEDEIPRLMQRLKIVNPTRHTLMQAQRYFADEDIDGGLAVIDAGLKEQPNSVELLFVKAVQYGQKSYYQQAFDIFNRIQSISLPANANTQEKSWHVMSVYQSGKVSAEHGVSLEQGKKNMFAFMESEQSQVEESWIRFRLGQILWQLNEKDFAKSQFELIPSLDPDLRLKKLMKSFIKEHRIKL